jgi:hypothetical protein
MAVDGRKVREILLSGVVEGTRLTIRSLPEEKSSR